jgi:hypothetical protein
LAVRDYKTLGGRTPERSSCGGFMPTVQTTLIPASGINQPAPKKPLKTDAQIRQVSQFDSIGL